MNTQSHFTQEHIRQALNLQTDNHHIQMLETKSPLSPWLPNKKSSKRFGKQRKNSHQIEKEKSETGSEFLKQIKCKRKNFLFKPKYRHKTEEYVLDDTLHQIPEQVQSPKEQYDDTPSLLLFPFSSNNTLTKQSFSERRKQKKKIPKTTNNFTTIKPKQIAPLTFDYTQRCKTEKSEYQPHTPERSMAVTTIYGRKFRNKFLSISKSKNFDYQKQQERAQKKKLSLQEIHKLIGTTTTNKVDGLMQNKIKNIKYERKNKIGISKQIFTNKYIVEKGGKSNTQIISQKKIMLTNLSQIQPKYDDSDGWLAPRAYRRGNSLRNSEYTCKTIYI